MSLTDECLRVIAVSILYITYHDVIYIMALLNNSQDCPFLPFSVAPV
jgi:hypothetical protein